jgi:hypothetical protein
MKKVMVIALFASFALASCKKERVCECVVTSTVPGSTSATYNYTVKKAKKDVCAKNSSTTLQTVPAGNPYTSTVECTLK